MQKKLPGSDSSQISLRNQNLELLKFSSMFLLTTVMRAKLRQDLPKMIHFIRKCMKANILYCIWFIEVFTKKEIIREFLIDCTVPVLISFSFIIHSI
jgi:hypothetical protein